MIFIAIATSAYFIGASVVESDIANVQDNILHHEEALKFPTNAVGCDHEILRSVVNQIRIDIHSNVLHVHEVKKHVCRFSIESKC